MRWLWRRWFLRPRWTWEEWLSSFDEFTMQYPDDE